LRGRAIRRALAAQVLDHADQRSALQRSPAASEELIRVDDDRAHAGVTVDHPLQLDLHLVWPCMIWLVLLGARGVRGRHIHEVLSSNHPSTRKWTINPMLTST